jgi:hypothetical protein
MTMGFEFPVEPGHVMMFALSVGDGDPVYRRQLFSAVGTELAVPPTFAWSCAHFDPEAETLPTLPRQLPGRLGGGDRLHAEQHFEYFEPVCAGDALSVETSEGASWSKPGRAGDLTFTEWITDFRNQHGRLVIRARKVGVRIGATEQA